MTMIKERPIVGQTSPIGDAAFSYDMLDKCSARRDYYEHNPPTAYEAVTLPLLIQEYRTRLNTLDTDLETAQRKALAPIHDALKAVNAFNACTLSKTTREYLELKHTMQHSTEAADSAKSKINQIRSEIKQVEVWLEASELRLEECKAKGIST